MLMEEVWALLGEAAVLLGGVRHARALRALGLLLADGVPIVGLVKTFWRETGRTGRKRP